MNDFSAFADLMKQFIELFDTLIPIEQDKLDATVKNRVAIVEDFMQGTGRSHAPERIGAEA